MLRANTRRALRLGRIANHPDRHSTSSKRKAAKAAAAFEQANAAFDAITAARADDPKL